LQAELPDSRPLLHCWTDW